MSYWIVIPARYQSSRLPGKPLQEIAGHPMIWHVWQRALETGVDPSRIWIATDDERIEQVCRAFGAQVQMTSPDHPSGTDRLAEVARLQGWPDDDTVVNLQGDEPLINPELLTRTAEALNNYPAAGIATLACPINEPDHLFDPNVVKVVTDAEGYAHYFSRAAIPWDREGFAETRAKLAESGLWLRHIGMYGYRVSTLHAFTRMAPAPTEKLESLEQLRAMWHGVRVHVSVIDEQPGHGVDTPEDLAKVKALLER